MILLDNIEVIFDVALKQDPLRLLQRLSRNKTVVAAWPVPSLITLIFTVLGRSKFLAASVPDRAMAQIVPCQNKSRLGLERPRKD